MNFTDARHSARMSLSEVAEYLEISLSTVKRYDKTNKAPRAVIECLLMIGGKFPSIAVKQNGFAGWSFGQGYLWSPGGERFTSGDILASRINQELINALYRSNLKLRKQKEEKKLANTVSGNVIPFPLLRK